MLVYVFEGMLIFFLYKPGIHDSPYSPGRKGLQCFDLEFIFCVVLLCSVTSDQIKHGLLAHPMLLNLVSALVILTFLEFTMELFGRTPTFYTEFSSHCAFWQKRHFSYHYLKYSAM